MPSGLMFLSCAEANRRELGSVVEEGIAPTGKVGLRDIAGVLERDGREPHLPSLPAPD